MPIARLTGSLLRERRLALGLRQGELAGRAGISASYLNLIEHNRRKVAPPLLERLAGALELTLADLDTGAEAGVLEDLRAAGLRVAASPAEMAQIEEFAGRFAGWAAILSRMEARAAGTERALQALSDRMSHDPYLPASLHEVLSAASSVRATAAILAETEDLEAEWRARFHQNLLQDSERLAVGASALARYLDGLGQAEAQGIASPQEEVEAWLAASGWQVGRNPAALASRAAGALAAALVAQHERDVAAMPDAALTAVIAEAGMDPVAVAGRFGVGVISAFRRLALRGGVEAGLVLCDGSGTLTLRKPVAGFAVPRFGAACPLWPLFTALGRPMSPVEAVVQTLGPGGGRFRVLAFCEPRYPSGARGPELREAAMLILPDPGAVAGVPAVGSSCRVCQAEPCPARREPSILTG